MPAKGGSTAQSGFHFQNSIAAFYLGRMIGKPDLRDNYCVTRVTNEASGEQVFVDDILVEYKDHHRHFIQVKESIKLGDEAWNDFWRYVLSQVAHNTRNDDRIVLYLGKKENDIYRFQELCKRASEKESQSQWKITNKDHARIFSDIKSLINKIKEEEKAKKELSPETEAKRNYVYSWSPDWDTLPEDDLAVSLLSKIEVEIKSKEELTRDFPTEMPKSNVEPALLFRILRDFAAESAIYNEPLEAVNFRKRLKDELHIEIAGTKLYLREEFEPETVLIDDGEYFIMGDNSFGEEAKTWGKTVLQGYRIGKYPLTNAEFAYYINEHGNFDTHQIGWQGNMPPEELKHLPVRGVTYFEAVDYCVWITEKLKDINGHRYRLASEAEWEKAARGNDGRQYPWGNDWEDGRCNAGNTQPSEVDQYQHGIYGCYDLVGNVPEWTCSLWGANYDMPDEAFQRPWSYDARNRHNASKNIRRVIRGGSYKSPHEKLRCSMRARDLPDNRGMDHQRCGFRVVQEID